MLDAIGQTGLGGSRINKQAVEGFFPLPADMPIMAGSGITLEYVDLTTGMTINPNLNPWSSQTKVGLRISISD
jgi:hypothetical protein